MEENANKQDFESPPMKKKTFREEAQKQDATGSECPDGRETEIFREKRRKMMKRREC